MAQAVYYMFVKQEDESEPIVRVSTSRKQILARIAELMNDFSASKEATSRVLFEMAKMLKVGDSVTLHSPVDGIEFIHAGSDIPETWTSKLQVLEDLP